MPYLKQPLVYFLLIFSFSSAWGQNAAPTSIDLQKARTTIQGLDSVTIYHMYAKEAIFGSLRGNDILLYWGKEIRNSKKTGSRVLEFTTNSLFTDSEFLAELGTYQFKDSKGNVKYKRKCLVVWKYEDGTWKLYPI